MLRREGRADPKGAARHDRLQKLRLEQVALVGLAVSSAPPHRLPLLKIRCVWNFRDHF
jgi:hypothetical protein